MLKNKDAILLESAYRSILLNEISSEYVKKIKKAVKDKELPFDNIFGNKLRIIIPLTGTETYNQIKQEITKIPNYSGFDPVKKEIIKKIKLDAKYGGGEKEQRINLGKAISSLKISDEDKKKFLNWFANYNTNLSELEDMSNFSIVISRSPIDVLRMSDAGSISSCHSEGGTYFHCAMEEARNGGPIAFLVNTDDLSDVSEYSLQNEEIFRDDDRDIEGIKPLARIRIRRYVDIGKNDIAIPEIRIYGTKLPGFYNSVKDFLLNTQTKLKEYNIPEQFYKRKITRTGGSYSDSSDSALFNAMFDVSTFSGSLPHEVGEEEADRADQFREELEEFQIRYAYDLKHTSIHYNVEQNDEVYYYVDAKMRILLGDLKIHANMKLLNGEIDLHSIKKYHQNAEIKRQQGLPEEFIFKFQRFLSRIEEFETGNNIYENDILSFTLSRDEKHIDIYFKMDEYNENNISSDTDEYAKFCRRIKDLDNHYQECERQIIKALYDSGLININIENNKNLMYLEDPQQIFSKLKHFKHQITDDNCYLDIVLFSIPDKSGIPLKNFENIKTKQEDIKNAFGGFLEKYLTTHLIKNKNDGQTTFKGFLESLTYKSLPLEHFGIMNFEFEVDTRFAMSEQATNINFLLDIHPKHITTIFSNAIFFLDNHIDDIKNIMKLFVFRVLGYRNDYTRNIEKVYSKYI